MGKLKQGILGLVTGKVGNTVSAKWKNLNTIRVYQPDVHNPNTTGQLNQRRKFSIIVKLIRQVLPIINFAYDGAVQKMSPFNKATSINVQDAFTGTPPVLDHTKVVLCDNIGSTVRNATIIADVNQVMKVGWEPNTLNADELASMLSFVFFNCDTNEAAVFNEVAARNDSTVSVVVPKSWVGAITALHIMSTDYIASGGLKPKYVLKFAAQADLANVVK